MTAATLPAGTVAQVHTLPADAGLPVGPYRHVAVLARPPVEPTVDAFRAKMAGPAQFMALLTHDAGMDWPDKAGLEIAAAALEHGGMAMLCFAKRSDAVGCKRRVDGGSR